MLIIILERKQQKVAAKLHTKGQLARFARFCKAARFNYFFKRMMLKWRNKALIPRPLSSLCVYLTEWLEKRASHTCDGSMAHQEIQDDEDNKDA